MHCQDVLSPGHIRFPLAQESKSLLPELWRPQQGCPTTLIRNLCSDELPLCKATQHVHPLAAAGRGAGAFPIAFNFCQSPASQHTSKSALVARSGWGS
jgi:hypothetical protein